MSGFLRFWDRFENQDINFPDFGRTWNNIFDEGLPVDENLPEMSFFYLVDVEPIMFCARKEGIKTNERKDKLVYYFIHLCLLTPDGSRIAPLSVL